MMMGWVVSYSLGIEKGKRWRTVSNRPQTGVRPSKPVPRPLTPAVQAAAKPVVVNNLKNKNLNEVKPAVPAALPAMANAPTVISAKPNAVANPDKTLILTKPEDAPVVITANLGKFYTIQIASYKSEKIAQREADLLKQKGYDILVVPKGSFFIICVGKFNQKEQAKSYSQKLKKQYKDCLVRSM